MSETTAPQVLYVAIETTGDALVNIWGPFLPGGPAQRFAIEHDGTLHPAGPSTWEIRQLLPGTDPAFPAFACVIGPGGPR